MRFTHFIQLAIVSTLLITGCQKDMLDPGTENSAVNSDSNNNTPRSNIRLSYGDSLFNLKYQPGNYTILPVTKPADSGYFKAIPAGLSIDSLSGRINITQSETGLRYKVYYLSPNGTRLDSVKLVVSGIDYQDAIVELASTPSEYDTSFPIYNARPELSLPCGNTDIDDDGGLDDDDNGCVFDETDLDEDGNDDIAGVIQDKLLVDIKKGTIDLEASFQAGVFGSSEPSNGLSKDFTFYYRLMDSSKRALNKITIRLYHFKKRSDIPQSLLDILNERKQLTVSINSKANNGGGSPGIGRATNNTQSVISMDTFEFKARPKRPPIIIIVSQ